LQEVVEAPHLLELVVGRYLFRDLVGPAVWDGRGSIEYWFDDVTSCKSDGTFVELAGVCCSKS